MKIVIPNRFCYNHENSGPDLFLAGPVQGGDDWQAKCCEEILKHIPNFRAIIPYRLPTDHPLLPYVLKEDTPRFDCQLAWERYYLGMASQKGCIIFWLPCESKVNPRVHGPYARDTYGELGEWRGRLMNNPNLRVVVGGESGFHGLDVIRRNFSMAIGSDFLVHPTLADTVIAAMNVSSVQ